MQTWNGLIGVGLAAGLTLAGSQAGAQVPEPPPGVRTCTDISAQQPRQAILGWANSLRRTLGDTTHGQGGHSTNLTFENPRRIGPKAHVRPVGRINEMSALSTGRVGTLVALVWVDPDFQDDAAHGNARGYAPLDLPPGYSWIMMCDPQAGSDIGTALIIPEDDNLPLKTRSMRVFGGEDPPDQRLPQPPNAQARFQAGSEESLCVSCIRYGWCEM